MATEETPVEVEVVEMEVELQVYDKVSADVDAAMERCAKIILCYATPKDVKESKSWIHQNLRRLNALIDHAHKEGKAEALKFTQAMDTKKNELREKVAKQIEEKYAPIKAIEDAEAKKKADEEAKIKAEEERMEAERIAEIEAAQKKLAEEQAELAVKQAEFDRKERDARVAENVRRVTEHAAKSALEDAENRRIADVQRAKDEAAAKAQEKERLDRGYALQLESQEQERKDAEEMAETKRINDKAHRLAVNKKVYEYLACKIGKVIAKEVFNELHAGTVPYTSINY